MDGEVSLCIDRSPSFARLFELLDPNFELLVAERENVLVGAVAGVGTRVTASGSQFETMCIRDLKVAPACRSGTVAIRLVKDLITLGENRFQAALALFSEDNRRARAFAEGRAGLPPGVRLADMIFHNVFAVPLVSLLGSVSVRPFAPDDWSAVFGLLRGQMSGGTISPIWSRSTVSQLLNRLPGFSLDDVWVAESRGKLTAVLGSWNPDGVVRYRVLAYHDRLLWIRYVANLVAAFGVGVRIPSVGDFLRSRIVILAACSDGYEGHLNALFDRLARRCRSERLTHFTIPLPAGDPRVRALPRALDVRIAYVPYIFSNPSRDQLPIRRGEKIELPLEVFV